MKTPSNGPRSRAGEMSHCSSTHKEQHDRNPAATTTVTNGQPRDSLTSHSRSDGRPGARNQLAMWRRRHLSLRTVVVVVVLGSLLAPEAAAIITAAL